MAGHGIRIVRAVQDDRGTVTAEFAAGLPAVLLVLVLAISSLQAGALHLRVADAASVAARTNARGDPSAADGLVNRLVGTHRLSTAREGDLVCATVSAPIRLGGLDAGGLEASARSCSLGDGR
ncbi:hypothetical protein C5B96_09535 [Subtercola sp. Z020]|uniref:TadE family type IV pilus minor pilin n=1 Tax=Subtercola sp. Z020 TaxID=2080582 RepID=UPI000CE923D6|nr:TadE family type IV pilus minor pilin [Subtercola sp. Z020]PPF82186.1 hypothetical protein C5B96_09535 [Subtercola sp. Z020]